MMLNLPPLINLELLFGDDGDEDDYYYQSPLKWIKFIWISLESCSNPFPSQ